MGALTRESLKLVRDLKTKTVSVPEWNNEDVTLSEMCAEDAIGWRDTMDLPEYKDNHSGICITLIYSIVNDAGERVFTMEDLPLFRRRNIDVLRRLSGIALELNGVSPKKKEERKNDSGEAPTNASPSVSH